jgi:uncharacterized protein YndB with AHSA1/START domain
MPPEETRTDDLTQEMRLSASPDKVYAAWVDAELHAMMTGGAAESDPVVGGRFTAWDGYISGTWLALDRGQGFVQAWRTSEFPDDAPDSRVEVSLAADGEGGTNVTLRHTQIPAGQGVRYDGGWEEFYWEPMRRFFASL